MYNVYDGSSLMDTTVPIMKKKKKKNLFVEFCGHYLVTREV